MSPKFNLVTCETNQETFHGLYASPPGGSNRLVVHIHGTWGNFYGNPFIESLAKMYIDNGCAFLTANFPGHDETSITENFEDFEPVLKSWLNQISHGELILQGHSLGALKILSLRKSEIWPKLGIIGTILLSPFDVVRFYEVQTGLSSSELRNKVKNYISIHGPEAILASDLFGLWPISGSVVLAAIEPDSKWNQFPSSKNDVSRINSLEVPTYVAIGADDFASNPAPAKIISLLTEQTKAAVALIKGAPHNFAGKTEDLAQSISQWMNNLT